MKRFLLLLLLCSSLSPLAEAQTTRVKKVLLQGFWWDYKNNNYPDGWANYLTDLAPRLKTMGVDAIWIPPTVKNQNFGEKGVGYAPYDHYDLGDKFQKGDVKTRLGTKDELLRMIAVMHANGIEVVQDIVPNHLIGAGSDNGGGGIDPAAPLAPCTDQWKNFRYACYKTPATTQSAVEYLAREGRFPKNHQNFHPSPANNCNLCDANANPICWQGFGPDVDYTFGAHGLSSNATFNPDQTTYSPYGNGGINSQGNGYMRKHTREWLLWYKRQSGFDGVRVDAVKHFPNAASEDFLFNLQNTNLGWANGTNRMFAVGEWVGDAAALDAWCTAVQNRSGTFDFSLRAFHSSGGLRGMIYGNGGFDMGNLPGGQQFIRYIDIGGVRIHRTVPFINNHDTYRPCFDATGNIIGWKDGVNCAPSCLNGNGTCSNDELSQHVDIREPRLAAAYAAACAMDGNPQVFFEDLFNVANTSKRWSHLPTSTTDLPANSDIANIMLAHGALDFKGGDYKVPSNTTTFWNVVTNSNNNDDILVIERSGKAIIGITDQWNVAQDCWVDTDFPVGTVLKDYSGGYTTTTTVQCPSAGCNQPGPNRVNIRTRPVGFPTFAYSTSYSDHGVHYHGYSIWAPDGINLSAHSNPGFTTTQQWEMEDDLGDSHCSSLGQGGRTPDNSPNARVVGKIFVAANTTVTFQDSLTVPANGQIVSFWDLNGQQIHSASGAALTINGSFVNTTTRWITIKIRNLNNNTAGQKSFVRVTYMAPADVSTAAYPSATTVSIWTSNGNSANWNDCKNWEEGRIPPCNGTVIIPHEVKFMPTFDPCFTGTFINNAGLSLRPKVFLQGAYDSGAGLMRDDLRSGAYLPTTSPYGGGETTTAAVFSVTGNNAIVDWVRIELRDENNPGTVVLSRACLLQRDGDLVGVDGVSPVFLNNVSSGNYYLAIRHRNHLGVMSALPVNFSNTIQITDFTIGSTATWGIHARRQLASGAWVLWGGNSNGDNKVKYQGGTNDANTTLNQVLNFSGNTSLAYNYDFAFGYFSGDCNMDGKVKYQGSGNDANVILSNVLNYPGNVGAAYNYDFLLQQLP